MCSHYEAPSPDRARLGFGLDIQGQYQVELWPTYTGVFIRKRQRSATESEADDGLEALPGVFGLLPFWTKDITLARHTYNCRSETASSKPSFRSAWARGQHCIIPATAIYEPDWRSGKAVSTRISRADNGLMGIAGLWERWVNPAGEEVLSYSMLTINADQHPLMSNFHKPQDEKRMVVIVPNGRHQDWLNATAENSLEFMRPYPADRLSAG